MIEELAPGVTAVGTAHIAAQSVAAVEQTIREMRPDRVLVELDAKRFDALRDPEAWKRTDIFQVIKQKKQHVFLLQLYLASMQAKMGRETGVAPGAEMLRAVQVAEEIGAEVVLIDRDVSVTIKRGMSAMGFFARVRTLGKIWWQVLTPEHPDGEEDVKAQIDRLLESDAITQMTEEFAEFAPGFKHALIDERDAYMADHILRESAHGTLVAVVGAGHMPGIRRQVQARKPAATIEELDAMPRKRFSVGKLLAYAFPALVLGMFGYLIIEGRFEDLWSSLWKWIVINGGLAAIGVLLARGHIYSALTAFVAAPLTSINPLLAAGWFAGAVEAKMHTPTVEDFEAIKKIETTRDFWKNGVVRILLVTALANLGSSLGTPIAAWEIFDTIRGGS